MSISGLVVDRGSIEAVVANAEAMQSKMAQGLLLLTQTIAKKMEAWAKDNAPWEDRSGNARQFLRGDGYWETSQTLVMSISHTMEYGVWLELAHERKYAILEKAIDEHKDELLKAWRTVVDGI